MRKSKLLILLVLIVIVAMTFASALIACDRDNGQTNSGDSGDSGEIGSGSGEVPPSGGTEEKPVVINLTQKQALNTITSGIPSAEGEPDKALSIDFATKVTAPDGKNLLTFVMQANIFSEIKNEILIALYMQGKDEPDEAKELKFGLYVIDGKGYIDLGKDENGQQRALLYLSDFDINYLMQMVEKAPDKLGDLKTLIEDLMANAGIGLKLDVLFDALINMLFKRPTVTGYDNTKVVKTIEMEIKLRDFLGKVSALLGGYVSLPVDLNVLMNYLLENVVPEATFFLVADFEKDGTLSDLELQSKDSEGTGAVNFDLSITTEALDIPIPDVESIEVSEFSLTNLNFAVDLTLGTRQNADGSITKLDVGKLINGFMGQNILPVNILMLQGGTGLRLKFALDLDLNYDKQPVDNNKMAIELFLIDQNGNYQEFDGGNPVPQMGIYYTEGSFYLNMDRLLPDYMRGVNVKVDADLSALIDGLVKLITDAIDGVFGISYDDIKNSEMQVLDNGQISTTSSEDIISLMSSAAANGTNVLALNADENGTKYISAGVQSFIATLAEMLMLPENIVADDDSIDVIVNNDFLASIGSLIGQQIPFAFPDFMGDLVLSIKFSEIGLDSVNVEASIEDGQSEPAFDIKLKVWDFLIGTAKENLDVYIADRVDKDNTSYLESLNGVVDKILGGVTMSSRFTMSFNKGTYNLAPFIAGFGLPQLEKTELLWNFTEDFVLDAQLNIQLSLNRQDASQSQIVIELKTLNGIKVGETEVIAPNTVMIGIYGYKNQIFIDLSNLKVASVTLPKLSFNLNFSDLVYTLLGDQINKLLEGAGIEGGDFEFDFDLAGLLGLNKVAGGSEESNVSMSNGSEATEGNDSPLSEEEQSAIIFGLDTDRIYATVSLAAIMAILSQTQTEVGESISEALSLMEIKLDLEMGRKNGFSFMFEGELIPMLDAEGVSVYYYDENGDRLPSKDKDGNIIYYEKGTYASKKYNYGSDMKLTFRAGNIGVEGEEDNPIIVGDLGDYKYPMEEKIGEFEQYQSDLVQALVSTIGEASIKAKIDLATLNNEMNLTNIINNILASSGQRLNLPINLNLDDWNSQVDLVIQWDLDLKNSANSTIVLTLAYEGKQIFGVYVYRNSLMIDLEGLGFFQAEIVNSSIITKVFAAIDKIVSQIEGLDLNTIIGDLLEQNGLPTIPGTGESEGEVAEDDEAATAPEDDITMDIIKYILQAVGFENTRITANISAALFKEMLNELAGINLGFDISVGADLDLFGGNEFVFNVGIEDIETTITMQLAIGEKPEVNLDYDAIPDWDATNGEAFTKALLDNLNIGFTIDIANFTGDTENTAGDKQAIYTRAIIEKLTASKSLPNTANNIVAPKGSFLITLAHIDETRYNNSNAGTFTPLLYVILDYTKTSGQLRIILCQNVINFVVDLGNYIDIPIDLDLVGTLAPVFDNLFSQIDGALDGLETIGQSTETEADPQAGEEVVEPAAETPSEELTGFDKIFAELDIVELLGGGINASLLSNGNFTVNIKFDTYLINKLLDDVLSMVFGPETILDLSVLAPDIFSDNYLSKVKWTREYKGEAYDTTSFWGTLSTQIPPILSDVIKNMAGLSIADWAIKPLIGGVLGQIRGITAGILPMAVFNELTANIEVADATIANISIEGFDWGQDIKDENGNVVYQVADRSGRYGSTSNNSVLRRDGYFTSIKIYNTSQSVGKPVYDDEGNELFPEGIVTWDEIPTQITFDPYAYASIDAGVQYIINTHFTGKQASYQKAQDLYKTEVQFTIISENGVATNKAISELNLNTPGEYIIKGVATFNNGVTRELQTVITVLDDGGGVASIEPIEMHVYDELPDFVTLVMKDGTTRKLHTRYVTFQNNAPTAFTEHTVTGKAILANGTVVENVEFRYLDSTIIQINIEGAEGNVITIDLYDYNIGVSKITDYISDIVFFKYSDGLSTGLEVEGEWVLSGADEFFNRELDKEGMWSTDVSGTQFSATNTIGSGATAQEVQIIFPVKTKDVAKLTINGLENTLRVDPYRYYMYLITGDEQYNPFTTTAIAEYYDKYMSADGSTEIIDSYSEEVNISWGDYSNVDFSWNNDNTASTSIVASLDNSKYPNSSFTWDFDTNIVVMRNEVEGIYFDEELTQYTYYIDPFEYFINEEKGIANYPDHAYVKFTNGKVYYMPIKWMNTDSFEVKYANQFAQLEVMIGFDEGGKLEGVKGNFEQTAIVNVRVEDLNPVGIELAGSELTGGTFYIDPIQVNYFGMSAFPETVTVKYDNGKTTELPVSEWIYDFSLDSLSGQKNLKAIAKITDTYQYTINVEVIDRSAITTDLKSLSVDPYTFTLDEKGNRVYEAFTKTILTYITVGTIDLETLEVKGNITTSSMALSTEYAQYLQYIINYTETVEGEVQNKVFTSTNWDEVVNFINQNKASITSTEVRECYDTPVTWDLSEINYAVADDYIVRAVAGSGASQKTFRINTTIIDKKVERIGNTYYTVAWGGDNLTEEQKLTNKIVTNLMVYFSDGTSGSYECTIDISTIAYTNENEYTLLMTVETNEDGTTGKVVYKDSQGQILDSEEARMNAAIDVNVTIFSGDITINTTMKLHVLKQVTTIG